MAKIIKNLIVFVLALTAGLMLSFGAFVFRNNFVLEKQQSPVLTATLTSLSYNDSPLIPPHISLIDFYKTYGQRMLGNKNLKIISREEWGADNRYSNLAFIDNICKKEFCSKQEYNPENSFSSEEDFKVQNLSINYKNNFQKFDDLFLQTKKQANGINYNYLPVEEIIIHHTAGKFTTDFTESKQELQRIYFMHAVQRRWRDISYHFLIDGAGRIYEGNLGGKYSIGAHTYWHNNGTVAIALMGDFRPGHDELNDKMKKSLIALIDYLVQEYQWDISQPLFYLKKPDFSGHEWTKNIIKGHRELDIIRSISTSCPGIDPEQLRKMIYPSIFNYQTFD